MAAKPKMIVFDLDYTLWPYWCDTHIEAPFTRSKNGGVQDKRGRTVKHFPEVPALLEHLTKEGYVLAIASRTGEVRGANQLIELYGWSKYFTHKEIYPGCKITHFKRLQSASGFGYHEMLFFDDEIRNKADVARLGVMMILLDEATGMTREELKAGLKEFADRAAKK